MVQLALGALLKVGSALGLSSAAAASTTAAAAATTATTTAATGASTLGLLQGFATTLSALGSIGSGLMAAKQSKQMATEANLQAGQQKVAGEQRQTAMKRELASVLGRNDVTFAAAGIDLTGGLAKDAGLEAKQRAADEISIDQQDTDFQSALLRLRAKGYRAQAGWQVGSGLLSAFGAGANYALDLKDRG